MKVWISAILRAPSPLFCQQFFGDLPVRFQGSYFPFMTGRLRWMCSGRGRWLFEVMGCGMVDPAVLEGWAWIRKLERFSPPALVSSASAWSPRHR